MERAMRTKTTDGEQDLETRDRLVMEHVDLVKQVAGRLAHRLPAHVELSELTSVGVVGLLDAAGRFRPTLGVPFGAYARRRILGAMLDALRDLDWAPRAVRRMRRDVDVVIARLRGSLGREPESHEIARAMQVSDTQYERICETLQTADLATVRQAGADSDGHPRAESVVDQSEAPDARVERLDEARRLAHALGALPPRERYILSLYYDQDLRLADIARRIGVGESRVSQLRTQALGRLRSMLGRDVARQAVPANAGQARGSRRRGPMPGARRSPARAAVASSRDVAQQAVA
jgi:RNA polymerase sigma factor for flagellar operon FliA